MRFRPEILFICTLSLSILVPSCLGFGKFRFYFCENINFNQFQILPQENAIKFKIYVHSDVKWIKQVETPNVGYSLNFSRSLINPFSIVRP